MEEIKYPIRINRYLALNNYCSRREADALVSKGVIKINGEIAKLGSKVDEKDLIEVPEKDGDVFKEYAYFAYNKPKGIMTNQDNKVSQKIGDVSNAPKGVYPVGRLDKDSHGLIILTNDGRITGKLLDPVFDHEKEYIVTVNKRINNHFLKIMGQGVTLETFRTKECEVEEINSYVFKIILTEGKKHQIRRMCDNLGYAVMDIQRVRIENIRLGDLRVGRKRKIEGADLNKLLKKLGLPIQEISKDKEE